MIIDPRKVRSGKWKVIYDNNSWCGSKIVAEMLEKNQFSKFLVCFDCEKWPKMLELMLWKIVSGINSCKLPWTSIEEWN